MEDPIPQTDLDALIREKYKGDKEALAKEDLERLKGGEPLAYVIGNIPFLGLSIGLSSHPLIPRPETEWWTEHLIAHIKARDNTMIYHSKIEPSSGRVRVLDLCAGSGAIGLAILKHCPNTMVSFGEIESAHTALIAENLEQNGLDASRADIRTGDLFAPFAGERFDIIATNPPYIQEGRTLPESVTKYEPALALFGGADGLSVIRKIGSEASLYIKDGGELWMECDTGHIEEAKRLLEETAAREAKIRTDQYGRPRLIVGYY